MSAEHHNIPLSLLSAGGACLGGGSEAERCAYESRVAELLRRRLVRADHPVVARLVAELDSSVRRGVWDLRELRLYSVRVGIDKLWARLGGVPGAELVPVPRVAFLEGAVPTGARERGPKVAGWRGAKPKAERSGACHV